jgi:antitoxin (DNA-binding transcriptional repressor) of toxin-antitoxin stability system
VDKMTIHQSLRFFEKIQMHKQIDSGDIFYIIHAKDGGLMNMRFLSVRDFRDKSAQIWKDLPDEREMIITSNGRPIAILAAISESNFEESLKAFRQVRAVETVASLHRRSVDQGTDKITMDEIDAEIKIVRKKLDRV